MLDIQASLSSTKNLTKSQIKKLERQQRRLKHLAEQELNSKLQHRGLILQHIKPKTINQNTIFKLYNQGRNLLLHGYPGTGKTFVSMYLALQEVLTGNTGFKKVMIVRSTVPTRDMGFLPGKMRDKIAEYELPYMEICAELFGGAHAYNQLKNRGQLEFLSTSFLRGLTWHDTIVIVDEMQNLTFHELDTVITRLGNNSKIIFSGDFNQGDLKLRQEKQGLLDFMDILDKMKMFAKVEMKEEDIVRGGIVKQYIIAKVNSGRL